MASGATRDSVFSPIRRASRFALLVLGGLYTVGLLIVNMDLARYGLINVDLARPEYIMAGALWAFLMIAALAAGDHILEGVRTYFKDDGHRRLKPWAWFLADLAFTVFVLDYIIGTLSQREISLMTVTARSAWGLFAILMCALLLYQTGTMISPLLRQERIALRALFEGRTAPIYSAVALLSILGVYALNAHPFFAREFGGGKRSSVYLVIGEETLSRLRDLPVARSGGRLGPVVLLFETETMYMVKAVDDKSPGPFEIKVPAVGIAKHLVMGLVTAPTTAKDSTKTEPTKPEEEPLL